MKFLARGLLLAAALWVVPAQADIVVKDGAGNSQTIFDFTCFTTKHCSAHVNTNSAGTEIFTSGAAGFVQFPSAQAVTQSGTWTVTGSGGTFPVTAAAGAYASGAFAAGSVASGAMVDLGAIADAASTAGGTGSLSAKLRLMTTQLGTINTTLGTPFQAGGSIGNTSFASTQSGTWTVQPGNTANTTPWLQTISQGGNAATVSAAGALKVDGSAVTQPVSISGNQAVNVAQINGVVPLMGNGITGTGSPRVTIASDNTAFTVNAAQSGTWNVTNISGTVSLPTGAATSANQTNASQKTQIVDGAGNVIASTSNNLNVQCANCSGSGVSTADSATFTAGASLFAGGGGFFQTTATANALTSGQQGMWQMTANRAGFVNLRDTAGTAIGTSAAELFVGGRGTAGTAAGGVLTVQGVAGMTKLQVTPDSVALPANQSVNVSQINGVTPLMGNGVTGTGSQRVTIASDNTAFSVNATLSAETTKVIGTVNVAAAQSIAATQSGTWTVQPGNTANTTPWLVTAASATAPVSTMNSASANAGINSAMSAVFDDVTPTAITENNFGFVRMSANRNQYTTLRDAAGNERGANVDASNRLATAPSLVSGSVASGAYSSGAYASGSIASGAMVDVGAQADTVCATDTGTCTLIALVKKTNTNTSGSIPAGSAIIGKVGVDQTTPGTTNGVAIVGVNAATALAGNGATGTGSQRVTIANDNTLPTGWASSVAQASTTSGQTGPLAQGAVTTAAPTYTTAQTSPLSLTTGGALRVDNTTIAGTAISTGSGVMGAGTQRIAMATDSPGIVTLGQTTKSASVPMTIASDQLGGATVANSLPVNLASQYPANATAAGNPITASATGTTAATTATLAGVASKTTYICGFAIRANATAAATGTATVTGVVTATMSFVQWTAPLASGIGLVEQRFNPCVPASATNTGIAVVSAAPGAGGTVSVAAWGYQL